MRATTRHGKSYCLFKNTCFSTFVTKYTTYSIKLQLNRYNYDNSVLTSQYEAKYDDKQLDFWLDPASPKTCDSIDGLWLTEGTVRFTVAHQITRNAFVGSYVCSGSQFKLSNHQNSVLPSCPMLNFTKCTAMQN